VTLPLGPFSVFGGGRFDIAKTREALEQHVTSGVRRSFRAETLNAVGGAWRNLALLHMRLCDYPLEIVHQYEIGRRDMLDAVRVISQQSRGSLEPIAGISKRRLENLPHAAAVMEGLIERLDIQRVRLSAFGVREGLIFEAMGREIRRRDPLIAGCAALAGRAAIAEALGRALEAWSAPALGRLPPVFGDRETVLIAAACRLAEFGAHLHPDHRADLVFEQVLRAPIGGMTHPERAFLACAAFSRHTGSGSPPRPEILSRLLSPERLHRARAVGAALRLGCEISGRNPELLGHARLEIKPNLVVLEAQEAWAGVLLGEQTAKRTASLAQLLDRDFKLRSVAGKRAAAPLPR
jgi:exopolyphosphatase/guanosine-5'-triphosphate,3'-diphosphate pyrophosphatase